MGRSMGGWGEKAPESRVVNMVADQACHMKSRSFYVQREIDRTADADPFFKFLKRGEKHR